MDNKTYQCLLSTIESPKLIECLLVLSINNLFISYDQLKQYCNDNNLYGLNNDQFQLLKKLLVDKTSPSNNNDEDNKIINNHNYSNNSNSSNKIKFDCSIIIIIENNKNHINNNNKIITTTNTNKTKSFYKIWRNKVIKNQIYYHIRLYNKFNGIKCTFRTFDEFLDFQSKEYLEYVDIRNIDELQLRSNSTLSNYSCIKEIRFTNHFNKVISKGMIPDSITSIQFGGYYGTGGFNQSLGGNWLPGSLKTLNLGIKFQQSIKVGQLPESLTELVLPGQYKGIIKVGAIPKSVKNLNYKFDSGQGSNIIQLNVIPRATTNLEFDEDFNQDILPSFIPSNVVSLKFGSFERELTPLALPLSITELFIPNYTHIINENVLPQNLTSLELCSLIWKKQSNIVLVSLRSLILGTLGSPFNSNITTPNLTSFEAYDVADQTLVPNLLPQSITSIRLHNIDGSIPVGCFINYSKLKSLYLDYTSDEPIPLKTLPDSLSSLLLGQYNYPLGKDLLSNLPCLSTLALYRFDRNIEPGELPNSLLKLYLLNPDFNHSIPADQDNGLPESLESIYIIPENYSFINNFNLDFVEKYIQFIKELPFSKYNFK